MMGGERGKDHALFHNISKLAPPAAESYLSSSCEWWHSVRLVHRHELTESPETCSHQSS